MEETILGWRPPTIYDAASGVTRIATQDDVDALVKRVHALGIFWQDVNRAMRQVKLDLGIKDND